MAQALNAEFNWPDTGKQERPEQRCQSRKYQRQRGIQFLRRLTAAMEKWLICKGKYSRCASADVPSVGGHWKSCVCCHQLGVSSSELPHEYLFAAGQTTCNRCGKKLVKIAGNKSVRLLKYCLVLSSRPQFSPHSLLYSKVLRSG